MVNKELIRKRFSKSMETYELQADVQQHIARELAQKAIHYLPSCCDNLLEVGCGTGFLTREVHSRISINNYYLNDLVDLSGSTAQIIGGNNTDVRFIAGDAETINFPEQLDGVLSASTLQWLVDFPAFCTKVSDTLLSEGVFAFNTFGPNNMIEIKELMGVGLHYQDAIDLEEILKSSFEILETHEETLIRDFDSPRDVLRHLQATGVTATHGNYRWTKRNLFDFEKEYYERFRKGSKVTLTWHIYYFVCKKKTASKL